MASSPIPGALKEFVDTDDQTANLVFFYKDHKGETLRRAILPTGWVDVKVCAVTADWSGLKFLRRKA